MCGICGYSGEKRDKVLEKMMSSIRHRGPDDEGKYYDDQIQLGMVRLSIIDVKGGGQPISNKNGTVWVVFNGEIYNYIELRQELINKGHIFKTNSDTEVVVHCYEEYGIYAPNKFNGMFAIAIWDNLKKSLIVFRDRFGVKPLFYAYVSGTLVFGSEIKSLLQHPIVCKEIDEEALAHYFSLRNIPAPFTIFKDIRALLPGSMFIWNSKTVEVTRWYQPTMNISFKDEDEGVLINRLDELLQDSIRIRLRSDVPYGAYLSGGIDSSTVVGIMSNYSREPIKTFTIAYADSPNNKVDSYYARLIANKYSTIHQEYTMSWQDLQKDLPDIINHLDQPFAGVISSFWLSRFMSKYVTVALSGDGADDLFGSYGHIRLIWPIKAVQESERKGIAMQDSDFGFFINRKNFVIELAKHKPWEWRLAYAAFMEHEKPLLFSEKGKKKFSNYSASIFLRNIYKKTDESVDELNKMLYLDINTLLPNEILYFNDILSMAHSMEVRTPFLDYRIAELACSIPGSLKVKNLTLKYILCKVASRYIPEEIIKRPKEGFVLPKNIWLRQGLVTMLKDVLSKKRLDIHGYFNKEYIDSLILKFINGDDTLTFKIWTLVVFQLWYENYLNNL